MERYIVMLMELLENDNSMAIRMALSAVKTCINSLLNSTYHEKGIQLLDRVFVHITDNYWLVRVSVCVTIIESSGFLLKLL